MKIVLNSFDYGLVSKRLTAHATIVEEGKIDKADPTLVTPDDYVGDLTFSIANTGVDTKAAAVDLLTKTLAAIKAL